MDSPWMISLVSNFWVLLLFLAACTCICHILLIRVWKLDSTGWKKSDYVWLTIASLALIKMASETRVWWVAHQVPFAVERVEIALKHLRSNVIDHPPQDLSKKFFRTESSPPKEIFDDRQRQYDAALAWVQSLSDKLPQQATRPFVPVTFADTSPPQGITDGNVIKSIGHIQGIFEQYESLRNELEKLEGELHKSTQEQIYLVLGPILVCIATAIRITKVTGEIMIILESDRLLEKDQIRPN
jgi:hypothetical protein